MIAIQTPCARTAAACAGSFELDHGRALSLQPRKASLLRVKQGRVWATLSGELGDHVLVPGSTLHIAAGDRVVIESWPLQGCGPVCFDWDPAPAHATAGQPRASALPVVAPGLAGQRLAMGQALGDLRAALGLAAGATARLVLGGVRVVFGFALGPFLGTLA